jgi:transposase
MQVTRIGMDIAKQIFELHGVDRRGRVVLRRTVRRERLLELLAQIKPCTIGMEACGGAHYWHRAISRLGHTVRLLSAHKVKPYVDGNKNNRHDAAAICEAMSRPAMRFVAPKSQAQQDLQTLHRARKLVVSERTALSNQLRGLLHEYGIVMRQGAAALKRTLPDLLASCDERLTPILRETVAEQFERFNYLGQRLQHYDQKLARLCRQDPRCRRLLKIEGVGPLSATALVATIGNGHEFKNGRHFSAYLGLVPGHSNTGDKTVMRGITKRGNRYLRTLLIHGGRSAVYAARRRTDSRAVWLNRLREASGHNVAAVALANKNARVAWAMLRYGEDYRPARAHRQAPPRRAHRSASAKMLAVAVRGAHPAAQSRTHFSVPPSAATKGGTKKCLSSKPDRQLNDRPGRCSPTSCEGCANRY